MPELIHQSALFNPLSGYGSYIFPAVAPIIVYQTIVLGLAMLVAGYRQRLWRASACDFLAIYAVALTIGCLSCFYLFGFVFWWHDYPRVATFGDDARCPHLCQLCHWGGFINRIMGS